MPTILYRILSFQPLSTWQQEPERDGRLSKLTRIFEAYCSLIGRSIRTDRSQPETVSSQWLGKFYYLLMGYLDTTGVDDDEIEDEVCPVGRFPIMTIHQSKGLEFPFVFVAGLGIGSTPGPVHLLEDDLMPFRSVPPTHQFSPNQRSQQDMARMFYVAYSRAQYALIIVGTKAQLSSPDRPAIGGLGLGSFSHRALRL
jgi:DNA helicase-2/ATP-dependent DNA helicase PcrA